MVREDIQSRNDSLWLDDMCDRSYYAGKENAHTEINKMIEHFTTPEKLRAEMLSAKQTSEASRDASVEGEAWAWYDGEVAGYREMINELDEMCGDKN